jgi:antitoxin ParD1/3/4
MKTRQSISLTEPNDQFLNSLISSGEFSSKSEVINGLIRQARNGDEAEIEAIRVLLAEGEESIKQNGYSKKSVDDIWQDAKQRHSQHDG